MADASYLQTSFLGGEWSPLIQGRQDDPRYRTGMNVTRNVLPLEEGSGARRPGTRLIAPTRKGAKGVLRAFDFQQSHAYNLELTAGHLRFLAGAGIVVESFGTRVITALNTGNPVQITVDAADGWSTNDEVIVQFTPGQAANSTIAALLGRQLEITSTGSTTFTVVDAVTGVPIDGTSMVLGSTDLTVIRIADFATPYAEADLPAINQVQDQTDLLLLHNSYPPQAILSTNPEEGVNFAVFSFGAAVFKDGPYLDPPKDGTTITPSAVSGAGVTLTLAGGSTRFVATDVGRFVRLFSEPAAWDVAHAYAIGDQAKFNGEYYQALKANTGKEPDTDVVNWGVATGAAVWNWATITGFTSATVVTATLIPVTNVDGTAGPVLPRTSACAVWRMGLFSPTAGYPANGTYHEGRLWLSGVVGNRVDASVSNDFFNFAPTYPDGTIADNNAIAAVFNAKDVNQIFWMEPDALGIICGTQAGEWLIQASATNDTLTPTSIQAHRRTHYGCANVPAKRAGITLAFVQRYTKKLLEYITTDFRGLSAHNIALTGKHLTQKGIAEIAYQSEKVPTLWARTNDGALLSCTYKRESPYASDPPAFAGWAHHDLGGGQTVESIQAGPNFDGTLDALSIVTSDGTHRWSQLVTDLFDVDWTIGDSLFVDFAETPSMWEIITGPPLLLRLYSLHYLAGKSVDVFAGGVDMGTLTVAADGHLDIPIDGTNSLLTSAWLTGLNTTTNFHGLGLAIVRTPNSVPAAPTVTGIQNFDLSPLTHSNGGPSIDFDGGRLFIGDAFDGKIASYSASTFKLLNGPTVSVNGNVMLIYAEDGYLYGVGPAGANSAALVRMDSHTFAPLASFGVDNGGFAFSTNVNNWAYPRDMDTVKQGNTTYLVSSTINASQTGNQISVLNLGSSPLIALSWTGQVLATDEPLAVVCKGTKVGGFGRAWVLATNNNLGGSSVVGLYRVLIGAGVASMGKIGFVLPSNIGTGWTHVTSAQGILLDETDGNIIGHFSTLGLGAWNSGSTYVIGDMVSISGHDFVSLQNANLNHTPTVGGTAFWTDLGVSGPSLETRIVKINVHTLAVMWSNVIQNSVSGNQLINQSRVRHGKYNFLDDAGATAHMHSINTLTGVDTVSAGLTNIAGASSQQFSDDQTGNTFANVSYTAGSVTQIGTTPASFASWATLGPAAGPAIPAAIPPGDGVFWTTPVAIGYAYPSQGQILRAIAPAEAGAQNGPALGKTRRTHMYAALLQQAQGIKFGTDFTSMRVGQLRSKGGTTLPLTTLYSAVHQDTLQDDYSFDSMLCWEIDRPYPATVCTLGAFLHTQDR